MKDRLAPLRAISNTPNDQVEVEFSSTPEYLAEFYNLCEETKTKIESIHSLTDEIKRLHVQILASPTADEKIKNELDERLAENDRAKMFVRSKLKEIEESIAKIKSSGKPENAEFRIRKTQFTFLSHIYTEAMIEFNVVQVDHRTNCKQRIMRQLDIIGKQTTEAEIDEMIETGNTQIFTEGLLHETKMAKQQLDDIQARHQDILKLENSIKELASMFIEIATLVESQGELIQNIEKNISQTTDYVQTAKVETEKAVVYQSKARRKKIILIIVVILIVVIILAIIIGTLVSKLKN